MSGTEPGLHSECSEPAWLAPIIAAIPCAERYVVALSGGLDSSLLLHLLIPFLQRRGAGVLAIHVHHGLSPRADAWADFCAAQCRMLNVPMICRRVQVVPQGEGVEAAARSARYAVFGELLKKGDVLLQGHHQNDQAETVLLRLMRGSGPEGLAAIPPTRVFGESIIYRPWLHVPRGHLQAQAQRMGISWVEDESNLDQRYDRNFLRHRVLPSLQQRWPDAMQALARVAQRAQKSRQISDALLDRELARLMVPSRVAPALNGEGLRVLEPFLQHALVRRWLEQLGVPQPAETILRRLAPELLASKIDSAAELRWGERSLRMYRGSLFYVSPSVRQPAILEAPVEVQWSDLHAGCSLNLGPWSLQLRWSRSPRLTADAVLLDWPPERSLWVGGRKEGLSIRDASGHRRSLKQVFQALGLPPWMRAHWPMLFLSSSLTQDHFICAGPGWIDPQFDNKRASEGLLVSWCLSEEPRIDSAR